MLIILTFYLKLGFTIVQKLINLMLHYCSNKISNNNIMGSNNSDMENLDSQNKYIQQVCFKGETLFEVDEFYMVNHPFHRYIGSLLSQTEDGKEFKGTAFLISPNIILTVTHNLFDQNKRKKTRNHRFYPGVNGELKKYYQIQAIYCPQEYQLIDKGLEFEFALLKLKERVLEIENGNFLVLGFGFNDLSALISIFGYPGDENYKPANKQGTIRIAKQKGLEQKDKLIKIQNNIISYKISTERGQSGSPIITGSQRNIVVGIHDAGIKQRNEEFNIGRHVNLSLIIRCEIWREQCKGDKFRVIDYKSNQQINLQSPIFTEIKKLVKVSQMNLISEIKKNDQQMRTRRKEMDKIRQQIYESSKQNGSNVENLLKENRQLKQNETKKKAELFSVLSQLNGIKKLNQQLKKELAYLRGTDVKKQFQLLLKQKKLQIEQLKAQKNKLEQQLFKKQKSIVSVPLINSEFFQSFIQDISKIMEKNVGDNPLSIKKLIQQNLKSMKNNKTSFMFELVKYKGKHEVCLGVLCKRKSSESGGFNSARTGINQNQQSESVNKQICFIPEKGEFQMVVDFSEGELTFKDNLDQTFYSQKIRQIKSPKKRSSNRQVPETD